MADTDLPRMIEIAGRLLVTETTNEARLAVAAEAGVRRVQFSAVIDGATTPLCAHLDGKVFDAGSPDAARFQPPLHINCRSIWIEVGDDEVGGVDAFDPADPELPALVEKHGHFVTDPERYAPLRVPSAPGSRDFVVRRRRDPATGELVTELEWKRPRYPLDLPPSPTTGRTPAQTGVTDTRAAWQPLRRPGGGPPPEPPPPPTPPAPPPRPTTGPEARQRLAEIQADQAAAHKRINQEMTRALDEIRRLGERLDRLVDDGAEQEATLVRTQLEAQRQALQALYARFETQREYIHRRWLDEVLLLPDTEAATVTFTYPTRTARRARQQAGDHFRRMLAAGTGLDGQTVEMADLPTGLKRARCERGGQRILLGRKERPAVVVHELGHSLEFRDPGVLAKAQAFLARRTAGESWQKLSVLTGNPAYEDWEVAKPDQFLDPYIGKDYSGATEVVSMGLQMMYDEPERLATDPDYFDLTWGIMRGLP